MVEDIGCEWRTLFIVSVPGARKLLECFTRLRPEFRVGLRATGHPQDGDAARQLDVREGFRIVGAD